MLIGEERISIADLVRVARRGQRVELSAQALEKAARARRLIDGWVDRGEVIYGITTGFGSLSDRIVSGKDARTLQTNLIMSHAAGVGRPFPAEVVRAVMAVRLKDLAGGNSGLRPETLKALADLLNSGIIPLVPEQGSVGASGDLCPMAHLALVLIGLGEADYQGRRMSGPRPWAGPGWPRSGWRRARGSG